MLKKCVKIKKLDFFQGNFSKIIRRNIYYLRRGGKIVTVEILEDRICVRTFEKQQKDNKFFYHYDDPKEFDLKKIEKQILELF